MLQQEFEVRTGYIPTEKEFEEINNAYMNSIDDKDEFCEKWKKENKKLVSWQKKAMKAAKESWSELYAEFLKWNSIAEIRLHDPLVQFHNAKLSALIEAETKRDQLKKHLEFLAR